VKDNEKKGGSEERELPSKSGRGGSRVFLARIMKESLGSDLAALPSFSTTTPATRYPIQPLQGRDAHFPAATLVRPFVRRQPPSHAHVLGRLDVEGASEEESRSWGSR
jgi:hypothetical protein